MIFHGDSTRLEYNRVKVQTILYPGEKWQRKFPLQNLEWKEIKTNFMDIR